MIVGGPNTVDNGLVLFVDGRNPDSYNGTSTKWINLINNGLVGSLTTSAMWDETKNLK